MALLNTALSLLGCAVGILIGLIIGYFVFIYFLDDEVKEPIVRSIGDLDSKRLHRLLLEIPLWVKSSDYERVDWLNNLLCELWPYLDKAVCKIIRDMTVSYVGEYGQRFKIESIDFKSLTLGTLPPKLQGIKFYESQEDAIIIEPSLKWAGNPNINISMRSFGVTLSIQIIDFHSFILPRITMKPLVPAFPCFSMISVSLMEEPKIDFGLKVCGADLMAIPFLYRWVQDVAKDQVAQLYLWPNSFDVTILENARSIQKAVGILLVKVVKAENLKKMDIIGKSDPYVKLKLSGDKEQSWKTTVKMKTLNPVWNELFTFTIRDPKSQALEIHAYDWDKVSMHDWIGMQIIPLKCLTELEPKVFRLELMKTMDPNNQSKKTRGSITMELTYKPVKIMDSFSSFNGVSNPMERSFQGTTVEEGIIIVTVHRAEDLEGRHHTNPYVKIIFMGEKKTTTALRNNRDPRWEQSFEFMLQNTSIHEKLSVEVFSKRMGFSFHSKESLGFVDISLSDVVYNGRINEMYNLIDSKNGKIHLELEWKA